MKLKSKLISSFLLVGIIPLTIVSLVALNKTVEGLNKAAFNQLEGLRAVKKEQIEEFFYQRENDTQALVDTTTAMMKGAFSKLEAIRTIKRNQIQSYMEDSLAGAVRSLQGAPIVSDALHEFDMGLKLGSARDEPWKEARVKYHKRLAAILEANRFADLMLVSLEGDIVYTVGQGGAFSSKEGGALGENLNTGKLKDTGLAKAFNKVSKSSSSGTLAFVDFERFAPSKGLPAAFLVAQITDADDIATGVLAIQVPLEPINAIMQERTGLGETGETYLIGPDHLMRSTSVLDRDNRSVSASFAKPEVGRVNTESASRALTSELGVGIIEGVNGSHVVSAFSGVEFLGMRWGILAEVSVEEAILPVDFEGNEYYQKYIEAYKYNDMFLIMPDGYVFYSANKNADFGTNIINGEFASSTLGDLTRKVLKTGQYSMVDFAPYKPAGNKPTAFVAKPVLDPQDSEIDMIVALQLNLETINTMMQKREGLGETGQTYLVGSDNLMRSDSIIDGETHTVELSFSNPEAAAVDTISSNAALNGQEGAIVGANYNKKHVLSAYAPVNIGELTWGLIAEIDESEAMTAVSDMQTLIMLAGGIGVLVIAVAGFFAGQSISHPITAMTKSMGDLAHGNLEVDIPSQKRKDEIGEMAEAVQVFKDNAIEIKHLEAEQKEAEKRAEQERRDMMMQLAEDFERSVGGVVHSVSSASAQMKSSAELVSATASETKDQSTTANMAAEEASANVETVASAAEELSSSISEISRQVAQSTDISATAVSEVEGANSQVRGLADAASQIGDVVALITDIADQTNLLALNATIEAARAGEAGKGFAVVASEVKNLANQTTRATEEISNQIGDIQGATQDAVDAIASIGDIINRMNGVSSAISAAIEEQGAATQEIARNVEEASNGTIEVSSNIARVNQGAAETGVSAQQMLSAAADLSQQSATLQQEVNHFLSQVRLG